MFKNMFKKVLRDWNKCIYRQSSVKLPPVKNTSSNNNLHIFHPFFTLPIITLAIIKIEQKSIGHLKKAITGCKTYSCNRLQDDLGSSYANVFCINLVPIKVLLIECWRLYKFESLTPGVYYLAPKFVSKIIFIPWH